MARDLEAPSLTHSTPYGIPHDALYPYEAPSGHPADAPRDHPGLRMEHQNGPMYGADLGCGLGWRPGGPKSASSKSTLLRMEGLEAPFGARSGPTYGVGRHPSARTAGHTVSLMACNTPMRALKAILGLPNGTIRGAEGVQMEVPDGVQIQGCGLGADMAQNPGIEPD